MRAGTLAGTVIGWQPERRVPRLRVRGGTSDRQVDALVDVACGTPPREGTAEGTPVQPPVVLAKATCGNCGAPLVFPARADADVAPRSVRRPPPPPPRAVAPGDPNARG